jgi:hypothetical protein
MLSAAGGPRPRTEFVGAVTIPVHEYGPDSVKCRKSRGPTPARCALIYDEDGIGSRWRPPAEDQQGLRLVPSKKTWIWIIVGLFGTGVLLLLAIAGAGIYFLSSHVSTHRTTTTDAFRAFDDAKASFKDQRPLLEVDKGNRPTMPKPTSDMPTASVHPDELCILAWDPDDEKVVQVTLPFWLLRLGRRNINISDAGQGFDLNRLNLNVDELERIGPALVLDLQGPSGQRVLVWTK